MGGTEPLVPPIETRRIFSEKHAPRSRRLARFGRVCARSRTAPTSFGWFRTCFPPRRVLGSVQGARRLGTQAASHYGQSFFGGDGIAESPSGVIYADASPFPFLAFYCNVELTPSSSAKALFKS